MKGPYKWVCHTVSPKTHKKQSFNRNCYCTRPYCDFHNSAESHLQVLTSASINQTSDAKPRVDPKINYWTDVSNNLPIGIFSSHSTFAHSNLMPIESDKICTNLFTEERQKDIIMVVELWTKQKLQFTFPGGVNLPGYVKKFDWWKPKRSLVHRA